MTRRFLIKPQNWHRQLWLSLMMFTGALALLVTGEMEIACENWVDVEEPE